MTLVLSALAVAALFLFSADAAQAALAAAETFVNGVMPALFPMMVICQWMPSRQNNEHYRLGSLIAVAFAFASGSPASSRRLRIMTDAGMIPDRAVMPLLAACGVISPMFFIGTLAGWTGMSAAAWGMLLSHWVGALAVGGACLAYNAFAQKNKATVPSPPMPRDHFRQTGVSLPDALMAAARALLSVLGAMMFFSVCAGIMRAAITRLFPDWAAANAPLLCVLWAALEIGGGSRALLSACGAPPFALLSALCGFGGLSLLMQNMTYLRGIVRPAKLLALRALHGAVSYGAYALVVRLFPGVLEASAAPAAPLAASAALSLPGAFALSLLFMLAALRCPCRSS